MAEERGLLSRLFGESEEEKQRRLQLEKQQQGMSLLGQGVGTTGSMRSTDVFDEQGNPVYNDPASLQQPRYEGTGFLGSQRTGADVASLNMGLINAGYDAKEAGTISKSLAPEKPTTLQKDFGFFRKQEPEVQKELLDFRRAGAQNINLGGGAGRIWTPEEKKGAGLPAQAVVVSDRNGVPRVLRAEKYTQPQILSGGFATRMNTATDEIAEIAGDDFDPAGVVQNIDIFGIPDVFANYMRSPKGQRYRQAQENWITANLRKESGAAIPPEETEREIKKWFPQPGDSKEVIAQKTRSRKDAQRSMIKSAGGAYDELESQSEADDDAELKALRAEQGK